MVFEIRIKEMKNKDLKGDLRAKSAKTKELTLRWILALTAVVTVLVYSSTFHLGFLHYGDGLLILQNPDVLHFNTLRMLFHGSQGQYLPMAYLSYAMENSFFGLQAFHFHLDNVMLHIANALLALLLFYRLSEGNFFVSVMGGLLFAVHPAQAETVTWISGRPELLAAFFILGSSHFYLRYLNHFTPKEGLFGGTYILCLLFFILSLLSSPVAVMFPLVFFLFDFQHEREFTWNTFLEKVPFFATTAVFISFTLLVDHVNFTSHIDPLLFFKNWTAVWWPQDGFPFHRTFLGNPSNGAWIASAVAALVLLVISMYRIKSRRQIIFGLGFFVIMILPDLNFSALGENVLAGQSFYLAILGLLYASSYILTAEVVQIPRAKVLWRPVALGMILVLTVSLSLLTSASFGFWNDDKTLWQSILNRSPVSALDFYQWGLEKCLAGEFGKGDTLIERSMALTPHAWRGYSSLGNCYRDNGKIPDAMAAYDRALQESPDNPDVLLNRGVAQGQSGILAQAIQDMKKAVEKNHDDSEPYFQLANLYQRTGATDDAEAALEQGLEIDPKSAQAHHNLGNIFLDKSQLDQAALQFKMALETDEKLPQTHFSLANVYAALGLGDRAQDEYQRSIELNPRFDSAHANLGLLLLRTGKIHDAEVEYKKALEINPKLLVAHRGLAEVYQKDGRTQEAEAERSLATDNSSVEKVPAQTPSETESQSK